MKADLFAAVDRCFEQGAVAGRPTLRAGSNLARDLDGARRAWPE